MSTATQYHLINADNVRRVVDIQQHTDNLFNYLAVFDEMKNVLANFPHDPIDQHLLHTATHMASIRATAIRNLRRSEHLIRQSAYLLVQHDIDVLLLGRPRPIPKVKREPDSPTFSPRSPSIPSTSATPFWDKPDFRPNSPIPSSSKVHNSDLPVRYVNLCTESDESIFAVRPPPIPIPRPPLTVKKPIFTTAPSSPTPHPVSERPPPYHLSESRSSNPTPSGQNGSRRCSICRKTGHNRATCTSARCTQCQKKGHTADHCWSPRRRKRHTRSGPNIDPSSLPTPPNPYGFTPHQLLGRRYDGDYDEDLTAGFYDEEAEHNLNT